MRGVGIVATCVGLAISAAGHAADQVVRAPLLDVYVVELCRQVSQPRSCNGQWSLVVQAGMNDVDRRCDSFLAWWGDRALSKEPVAAELSDIRIAADALLAVSGVSAKPLDLVAAVFGLPSASAAAQSSELLASADRVILQQMVLTGRQQFRLKIRANPVPDRPAAIRLLRDYLQLCMPSTIEASVKAGGAK